MWNHPLYLAVLADPEDDSARLILADWLEEQGDSLADFIRVQIAIADAKRRKQDPATDLQQREGKLYLKHKNDWLAAFHHQLAETTDLSVDDASSLLSGVLYHRGLPAWMGITIEDLIRCGDALLAIGPWDSIRLDHSSTATYSELAEWQGLRQFRVLATQAYAADVVELIHSPHLHDIKKLSIACPRKEQTRLAASCRAANLPRLQSCRVGQYRVK